MFYVDIVNVLPSYYAFHEYKLIFKRNNLTFNLIILLKAINPKEELFTESVLFNFENSLINSNYNGGYILSYCLISLSYFKTNLQFIS